MPFLKFKCVSCGKVFDELVKLDKVELFAAPIAAARCSVPTRASASAQRAAAAPATAAAAPAATTNKAKRGTIWHIML